MLAESQATTFLHLADGDAHDADLEPAVVRRLLWWQATYALEQQLDAAHWPDANGLVARHLAFALWLRVTGRISEFPS